MTMYANNSNIAFLNCNVLYADNNIFDIFVKLHSERYTFHQDNIHFTYGNCFTPEIL